MTAVKFECKDDAMAKYCQQKFGAQFSAELDKDPDKRVGLQAVWMARLMTEAAKQEWFDYEVDDEGNRVVLRQPDGRPKVLVPDIVVS